MAKRLVLADDGSLRAVVASEGKPYYVRGHEKIFTGFGSFAALLDQAVAADGAVIHGEIIPGTKTQKMRRLLAPDGDTPATIRDRPCPYIILDIDQLPLLDGVSVQTDPDEVVAFVRTVLPEDLRDVSFWFHHSHSAGTKPLVKLHLAFLLEKPLLCKDLERWVLYQNEALGLPLFDAAPYSPNDFIFVGNPLLDNGVTDPVPAGERFGVVRGTRDTAVLSVPDTWRPVGQRRNMSQQGDIRDVTGVGVRGIAGHLKRLGAECHSAIVDAVKAAFQDRELLVDDGELEARIEHAISNADWDYSIHSDAYLQEQVADIGRVIDWRRRIEEAAVQGTEYGIPAPKYFNQAEATAALGKALDGFFLASQAWRDKVFEAQDAGEDVPPAPLLAVKATTGLGKTRGVVARLLDSPFRSVLYVAPTHAVLEEIREALEREQDKPDRVGNEHWEIVHVYGRTHRDSRTKAPTMCQRADVAEEVQRFGGQVGQILCGNALAPKCPHYESCPFIEQQAKLRAVQDDSCVRTITLVPTDTLSHHLPGGVRDPDLVVIDEQFWGTLVSTTHAEKSRNFKLETMRGIQWCVLKSEKDDEGNVAAQRHDAEESKQLNSLWSRFTQCMEACRGQVDGAGFFPPSSITMSADDLEALKRLLKRCRINVELALTGVQSDAAIKQAIARLGEINERVGQYRALIDVLLTEKAKTEATRTGMVSIQDDHIQLRRAREPRALGRAEERAAIPTLFLDADLNAEIVRRWWPSLREDEVVDLTCAWSPHVKVVHVKGTSFSKSWALGHATADKTEAKRVEKHQRDLDAFIRHVMAVNGASARETMIVSYKDLITKLGERAGDKLYSVPEDPEAWRSVGWFNALAGIDRWKDVRVGFVIGRPRPTPKDYSDMARAIWGHEDQDWQDVEPDTKGFLNPPSQRFRLHTREGIAPATIKAPAMPDPRCDRIYRAVTWGQAMQADGRIRPVHRTADNPCILFVMGDVPRGMTVDAVLEWEDAAVGKFDIAVVRAIRGGGVIPRSHGGLAKFAPDLWKDAKAVEKACRLQEDDGSVTLDLEDKLKAAIRKVASLTMVEGVKPPLGAIELSSSTKGGLPLDQAPDGTAIHGAKGEVRIARQPGSPYMWLRIPGLTDTTLSAGLASAFGDKVTKVKIEDGECLTIEELCELERQARRHRNVELAWFKCGVVPPAPEDAPPDRLSTRAAFRKGVAEARIHQVSKSRDMDPCKRLAILCRETGAATLWSFGQDPAN
jgi:hypothetical protein